jgi:hypothetical protein
MDYTNLHYGSEGHPLQHPQPQQQKLQFQIAWGIVLVLIAWPLSWTIIAPVYIFLLPFEPLLPVSK